MPRPTINGMEVGALCASIFSAMRSNTRNRVLAVATGNAHKLREFEEILAPVGWNVCSIRDWLPGVPEPEETESDFPGNSALKARHALAALRAAHTDRPLPQAVVADDSGLAVEVLGGEPGVFSARFAERAGRGSGDAANRAELVRRLHEFGMGVGDLTPAAFVCAIHLVYLEGGVEFQALGTCQGSVGVVERGSDGFGYDRLFHPILPNGQLSEGTFGELSAKEKHALSHRGNALRDLVAKLVQA